MQAWMVTKLTFNCPTRLVDKIRINAKGTLTQEFTSSILVGQFVNRELENGTRLLLDRNGSLSVVTRR